MVSLTARVLLSKQLRLVESMFVFICNKPLLANKEKAATLWVSPISSTLKGIEWLDLRQEERSHWKWLSVTQAGHKPPGELLSNKTPQILQLTAPTAPSLCSSFSLKPTFTDFNRVLFSNTNCFSLDSSAVSVGSGSAACAAAQNRTSLSEQNAAEAQEAKNVIHSDANLRTRKEVPQAKVLGIG